jgi:S-adenosyl-L-homocysteine hydrolase/S-adenosyl-L-homocysteine hydrolase, NAD binding domain
MARLERDKHIRRINIEPQVDEFVFEDGHSIIVLSEGRLLNPGNATGHPSFVMSNSFSNQVSAQIELWTKNDEYDNEVYRLAKDLDEKVAKIHVDALGGSLTRLTNAPGAPRVGSHCVLRVDHSAAVVLEVHQRLADAGHLRVLLRVSRHVALDVIGDLLSRLALQGAHEGVQVRVGEQVGRGRHIDTGPHTFEIGGCAVGRVRYFIRVRESGGAEQRGAEHCAGACDGCQPSRRDGKQHLVNS